ncbi:MAG: WecB/TagA/CpsF family glycosyltransferase [Clostridiaceae bacterium]|jgi:N-acetylglucosaminyldiphosphoundecaprenol N-acetyl-beta-D-mannosaminyltransferase|nr:WecB/TagA/CpsF family glycosyltransferase [Clostridiaceae bacterium]
MDKTKIHGVMMDNVTMDEALEYVAGRLDGTGTAKIYTPNSEIMMQAQRDPELKRILNQADLLIADGAGVVLASRILGRPLKEKVSGIDLVKRILENTEKRPISFFILGARPGVAEMAAQNIISRYPGAEVKGTHHGYFNAEEEDLIIERINKSGADILLVGLGAPKQEKWIHSNASRLNCKVAMGVGGSIDVLAGTAELAPEWMRRAGLEWLFRLIKEPRRFRRMLDLPRFVLLSIKRRLRPEAAHRKTSAK